MGATMASLINSAIITVLTSALVFISTYYWNARKVATAKAEVLAAGHAAVLERLAEVESKLALVNAAVVPISTAFQAILIKELTHYHTPEMDALLVKVGPPNTLSTENEARLLLLLKERTVDMGSEISSSERDAAHILPAVMSRAKVEQATLLSAEEVKLKLISVATVIGIAAEAGKTARGPVVAVPQTTPADKSAAEKPTPRKS